MSEIYLFVRKLQIFKWKDFLFNYNIKQNIDVNAKSDFNILGFFSKKSSL